jgi:hypothetical protein
MVALEYVNHAILYAEPVGVGIFNVFNSWILKVQILKALSVLLSSAATIHIIPTNFVHSYHYDVDEGKSFIDDEIITGHHNFYKAFIRMTMTDKKSHDDQFQNEDEMITMITNYQLEAKNILLECISVARKNQYPLMILYSGNDYGHCTSKCVVV